jgi:hypothetical protein
MRSISHVLHFSFLEKYITNIFLKKSVQNTDTYRTFIIMNTLLLNLQK